MIQKSRTSMMRLGILLALVLGLMLPGEAAAHCDTLDGPVVADARSALARGEVSPVLKWVKPDAEPEIREVFAQTLAVRNLSAEAMALADRNFFENLVRIHRAGEGAPYSGLKSAGSVAPVVAKADKALEQGSVDELTRAILLHTEEGIRARFKQALESRKHAEENVENGREYVEAYVNYVHYVEGIAQLVHGAEHHPARDSSTSHQH
ncbi:hypothetical protein DBW_2557 [Desulfuromonas sp. DDH964]|uniref:DUF6448 family protein n=1 Tax=Desulfuromonas sp. DDH964 TaxID=1823759 RepID=UPI00078C2FD8|nr:DUF6448 family protein [Desulfuromonas sp. DDH964]AMV72885.1 hypothetical protein DBW_2557 [Desulfuromonas sp. DDH964]